jgi:hypothetical protein
MTARWAVHVRVGDQEQVVDQRGEVAERIYVELPGLRDADRLEYALEIFDQHGNRVIEIGTDDQPNVIEIDGSDSSRGSEDDDAGSGDTGRRDSDRRDDDAEEGAGVLSSPIFWVAIAAVVAIGVIAAIALSPSGPDVQSDVSFGVR